jgi:hypothetical protein
MLLLLSAAVVVCNTHYLCCPRRSSQLLQQAHHLSSLHLDAKTAQLLHHASYAAKMTHILEHASHLHPGVAGIALLSGAAVSLAVMTVASSPGRERSEGARGNTQTSL